MKDGAELDGELRDKESTQIQGFWYWANVYKVSLTMFALHRVGVLDALARGESTITSLVENLDLSKAALEPLLSLLVGMKLVNRSENGYSLNTPEARLLPLLGHEGEMHRRHIRLDDLCGILRGESARDPMVQEGAEEIWPGYLKAMAVSARTIAPHMARFIRLSAGSHLVDLGGADGSLAVSLSRLIPDLSTTVIDRPIVEKAFNQSMRENGGGRRFRFVAGDLRRPDDLAAPLETADALLLSNVLHLFSTSERESLLCALLRYAKPGALLIIYDLFLPAGERLDAASFMVIDWLLCGYSFALTEAEFAAELSRMDFKVIASRRIEGLPGALLCARIP